jgi:hypothetical protein
MRAVVAAISIALMTATLAVQASPSAAQKGKGRRGGEAGMKAPGKKVDDKAYKAALDSLPDKKLDPWRNMR